MRFYSYINEVSLKEDMHIDDINKMIHQDCKHYLNITQGKYIFKRGMLYVDIFGKKQVRQDRKPRGMKTELFEKLNKWLQKNGHIRRDKAVIAANIKNTTSMFGDVYWMFPIGKFDYTWLMAKDMNMYDDRTGWDSLSVEKFFERGFVNDIPGEFKDYFVTNSSLKMAWTQHYEIWFNCKEYYYFSTSMFGWNDKKKELVQWDS